MNREDFCSSNESAVVDFENVFMLFLFHCVRNAIIVYCTVGFLCKCWGYLQNVKNRVALETGLRAKHHGTL